MAEDVEAPGGIEEAREMLGAKLDEMGGSTVGRVEAVMVDAQDGSPTWLVARLGRFGRRCAIPFELAVLGAGHVWVPFDRELIKAAPAVDPAASLSAGEERTLAAHFEIPEESGRHAAVVARDPEQPGSVPAS